MSKLQLSKQLKQKYYILVILVVMSKNDESQEIRSELDSFVEGKGEIEKYLEFSLVWFND